MLARSFSEPIFVLLICLLNHLLVCAQWISELLDATEALSKASVTCYSLTQDLPRINPATFVYLFESG